VRGAVTAELDAPFVTEGTGAGRVSLQLLGGILYVTVEDETPGDCLLTAFQRGVAAGWVRPGVPTLVDLTRFTGVADWAAIRAIRALAPWGTAPDARSRVAYLVRHSHFAPVIEVVSALFARQRHKLFSQREDALAWLRT